MLLTPRFARTATSGISQETTGFRMEFGTVVPEVRDDSRSSLCPAMHVFRRTCIAAQERGSAPVELIRPRSRWRLSITATVVVAIAFTLGLPLRGGEATPFAEFKKNRVADISVRVVSDRAGWVYELGAPAKFRVNVIADGQSLSGVSIRFAIGPENQPMTEKSATLSGDDLELDAGTMSEPGFVRWVVKAQVGGRSYRALATIGFAPEKIVPTQVEPADFDAFWARGKSALEHVPLEPRLELIPEASRGAINIYHVSFRNWSGTDSDRYPGRIYGILCEPKAAGRYPAFLRVPASGVRPYSGERMLAERGANTRTAQRRRCIQRTTPFVRPSKSSPRSRPVTRSRRRWTGG